MKILAIAFMLLSLGLAFVVTEFSTEISILQKEIKANKDRQDLKNSNFDSDNNYLRQKYYDLDCNQILMENKFLHSNSEPDCEKLK